MYTGHVLKVMKHQLEHRILKKSKSLRFQDHKKSIPTNQSTPLMTSAVFHNYYDSTVHSKQGQQPNSKDSIHMLQTELKIQNLHNFESYGIAM